MEFKKRLLVLLVLTGVLGLVYTATVVFDPERVNSRDASYVWLQPEQVDQADRVEIYDQGSTGVTLIRNSGGWFVSFEGEEYPAKQSRVEDLFRILSTNTAYPIRASSAASHEKLGLAAEKASRIIVRGGPGTSYPLLDLLIGEGDASGKEVYLRKNTQDEVRSGENKLASYITGARSSWYNLRLFPENEAAPVGADMVQRIILIPPPNPEDENSPTPGFTLSRNGANWIQEGGGGEVLDTGKVESYIRAVMEAEGEDFISSISSAAPVFTEGQITLQIGDNTTRVIKIGPLLESGNRSARSSGSNYVYSLAEWTMNRIFRDVSYFVTQ
ncbi:DUF4340 domain-containing protein [Treponema sp. TIM-1]|uniref:DUF4340 domain-containing protein n=1 Tax=Treponema sp. TIM-1 TaxID=2898417 RepID=UPI00397F7A49